MMMTITQMRNYLINHWVVIAIVVALAALFLKWTNRFDANKPVRQAKKYNKKIQKQYKRDVSYALNLTNEILGLLDQRMSAVNDPGQLQYFKDQYTKVRYCLEQNQPLPFNLYDLLNLYTENYNDSSSQLASKMRQLAQSFREN